MAIVIIQMVKISKVRQKEKTFSIGQYFIFMEQSLTTSSVTTALTGGTESCVIEFVFWSQKQRKGISSPLMHSVTHA